VWVKRLDRWASDESFITVIECLLVVTGKVIVMIFSGCGLDWLHSGALGYAAGHL